MPYVAVFILRSINFYCLTVTITQIISLALKSKAQPFEEKVIAEILNIPLVQSFKLNPYKLQAIRDKLRMIIYPHKSMKRRCISIGVITTTD